MKIQCSCGAKYAFDVTPEMVQNPIRFVCPACGADSSEFVNGLIRQQFASVAPTVAPAPEPARIAVRRGAVHETASSPRADEAPAAMPLCTRHPGQQTTEHCRVCQKPICPKCMQIFGFVCSPLCKAKAEAQGIDLPEFAGQRSVAEARQWRWIGAVTKIVTVLGVVGLGFWVWYAWIGSVPKTLYSVRFPNAAYAGDSVLCGDNQIVFLHGGTLARHDLATKSQVWSRELVDPKQISEMVARTIREFQARMNKLAMDNPDAAGSIKLPGSIKLEQEAQRAAEQALKLYVAGQNVWVASPGMLTRYDWSSGRTIREIPLGAEAGPMTLHGSQLEWPSAGSKGAALVRLNLENGESRVESLADSGDRNVGSTAVPRVESGQPSAGLPLKPSDGAGQVMDPEKVAEEAQNLTTPAKVALPALLANAQHQERIAAEAEDRPRRPAPAPGAVRQTPAEHFDVVSGPSGNVELAIRMIEPHFVEHKAMKDAPAKSVLNADLTAAQSTEYANEMLNEMQRSRGGDTVTEDLSRYQVVVRQPDHPEVAEWRGEVIGSPTVYPLKTINVVTGGKTLLALDQKNHKLWQSELTYPVPELESDSTSTLGAGPCIERGDSLYVFDQAVLTAFDLKTGNVRWRLPTVGVVGLYFDDQGMLYVNTTTASPEKLKYSRQIDIGDKTGSVVLKVDPATGKTLWTAMHTGFICYLSGPYLYTLDSRDAGEAEQDPNLSGLVIPSHVIIRRLNLSNGREIWQHTQRRAPLSVHFDGNRIELVFKKEVQVLKFLSL